MTVIPDEDLEARISSHLFEELVLNFDKEGFEKYMNHKGYARETIRVASSHMGTIFKIFKQLPTWEELEKWLFKKKTAKMRTKYKFAYRLYEEYIKKVENGEIY